MVPTFFKATKKGPTMYQLFDSHAHYDDEAFDKDREALIASLPEHGVTRVINASADIPSSFASVALTEAYDFFYCAIGVHPEAADTYDAQAEQTLRELSAHPKVLAIGEIGLDYHYDTTTKEVQQAAFEKQLILAEELNLPVVIHTREATADTMALLTKYRPRGVVHCFSGSAETAKEVLKLGMYVGFTGVVTFKNARKVVDAMKAVPLDRLLIETDCPYLSPEPMRGKRCDSNYLHFTAEKIAAYRGIAPEEVMEASFENTCRLYGIK